MTDQGDFRRLSRAVERIAHHHDDPGRQEDVCKCLREIDALREGGRLEFDRWARLVAVLLSGQPAPRDSADA